MKDDPKRCLSRYDILFAFVTLKFTGINFYFSEVKSPVMDKLLNIGFVDYVGSDRFFMSTDIAMRELAGI